MPSDETQTEPFRDSFNAVLRQQLAALKALSTLGRSLSSVLDLNEVLDQIVEAATTLTNAEESLLLMPDDSDGKTLRIRATKGLEHEVATFRIRSQNSIVGHVFQRGEPVLIGAQGLQALKTQYFVKSLLYVPLMMKGRIIGVLGVNNRVADRIFTKMDQELLLDLAAHAAIAIENARLYEERVRQNRQLALLLEADRAVNSTLSLRDVLVTIGDQTINAFGSQAVEIFQRTDMGTLETIARIWRAVWTPLTGVLLARLKRPMVHRAMQQGAYLVVTRDQPAEDEWKYEQDQLDYYGCQAMMGITIRVQQQDPVGFLELRYHDTLVDITPEVRQQLRAIALQMCSQLLDVQPNEAYIVLSDAKKLLDIAKADHLTLWLARGTKELIRMVEYGSIVYLEPPKPIRQSVKQAVATSETACVFRTTKDALQYGDADVYQQFGLYTVMMVPLWIKDYQFGEVALYDTDIYSQFSQNELDLLMGFVSRTATAIENASLYRDLKNSLTELSMTQAKLVQKARLSAIGELAAVVAHQINNPLTTVITDTELILADMKQTDPHYEGMIAIQRAGRRSLTVVKRLLSNARRNAADDEPQAIDLNQTITSTLELVSSYIERSKIKMTVQLFPQLVKVSARPGSLEDVWLNLLLNARDALASTTYAEILVSAEQLGTVARVTICDNGPGIPTEYLNRLFMPFFTTKPSGEGTGLGLYICKQIVDDCHGRISVSPYQDNTGTCITVDLPLV